MNRIFLLSLLLSLAGTPSAWALHILIDPGHGGIDQGAVHSRLKEAEVVLDVSKRLQNLLSAESGVRVSMTRTQDKALSLPQRTKMADQLRADLMVSLHANAAPDPRAQGVELFFQNSLPPDEDALYLANLENQEFEEDSAHVGADSSRRGDVNAIVSDLHRQHRLRSSLRLSELMSKSWKDRESRKGPSIKQAPLYVVSRTNMPSVLVELGFLTNPTEARRLALPSYRQELAERLRDAILAYRIKMGNPIQNETISK
ncbi:MAG: N-acetylmuramoyl-L-alanine amidase [Bdellovibrionaceae bacterium]|nr:N-acetylmuramoyl-L-alanine amidase [Pseudobdellovibrionaceae bacterium]